MKRTLLCAVIAALFLYVQPVQAQGCSQVSWASWCKSGGFFDKKTYRKPQRRAHRRVRGVSASCLPGSLKRQLAAFQRAHGPYRIISAHRPGARMPSGRRSHHASCNAADIRPLRVSITTACRFMRRHHNGGVGCYSNRRFRHVHIDTGPRIRWWR